MASGGNANQAIFKSIHDANILQWRVTDSDCKIIRTLKSAERKPGQVAGMALIPAIHLNMTNPSFVYRR